MAEKPKQPSPPTANHVVGAVKLALEAGSDDAAVVAVVRKLVDHAPTIVNDAKAVRLFLDTMTELGGRIVIGRVAEDEPPSP